MDTAPPDPGNAPPPASKKYTLTDYAFQFITVTAGVLIALLINSLVVWNDNRSLVREARAKIAQEIAENKREVESVLASNAAHDKDLNEALALATRLLANDRPATASMNLGFNTADLSTAGWETAASTGALAHMDYATVQQYPRLYSHQAMFAVQQARAMEQLTGAHDLLRPGRPTRIKASRSGAISRACTGHESEQDHRRTTGQAFD